MLNCVSREADAEHGVEDGLVGDPVADKEDLAVEARLQAVDVLPFPQARDDHWHANVDER